MSENKEYYPGISYQELFNFMFDNHNLLLSNSQMDDLITVIHRYYTHPLALSQERADFIREVNGRDMNGMVKSDDSEGFAEWILQNEFYPEGGKWWVNAFSDNAKEYSTAELYKLFKEK